jgi:Cu+-exporting ATPase
MKQNINLNISGMTCASCVNRVEKALKKDPAVFEVSVNLATEKAKIVFDNEIRNTGDLIKLVENSGYGASYTENNQKDSTHEFKKEINIIILSTLLTIPLVLPMLLGPFNIHLNIPSWLQWLLATPVQFYIGARFYKSAWKALLARTGNMDLLVAIGTSAAYGLSVYMLLKHEHISHLYFESSAVIITLVLFGKFLESRAKHQTTAAIKSLEALRPTKARIQIDSQEKEVDISDLKLGDIVVVRPGERVPIDGIIQKGSSQFNESLITGESLPIEKSVNESVVGGSINGDGHILFKVTALGSETMLSQIIRMVEDAQAVKPPIQRLVDKVAAYFVPIVLCIALVTIIATGLVSENWEAALVNGVAVLVIACPCALGLATPTSIMVGTGVAARAGILIKDAEALEVTHSVTLVAFDKTGTLTHGKPSLTSLKTFYDSEESALAILAAIQIGSEHPLATATLTEAKRRNISPQAAQEIKAVSGKGVSGEVAQVKYIIGNKKVAQEMNLFQDETRTLSEALEAKGETVSFLINISTSKIQAIISFKDTIKESAKETIQELHNLGIKTLILSGDNQGSVSSIAKELGIDIMYAEILPQEKSQIIQRYKEQGEILAMVGDGINDAPALALADVGMAMSTGTDVAMHSSGITLMRGNPLLIPDAISVSRRTYTKIKQNLFWAFIYNIIGIPLAALGYLSPVVAGAAMAFSSLSVVTNSLLLKRWRATRRQK